MKPSGTLQILKTFRVITQNITIQDTTNIQDFYILKRRKCNPTEHYKYSRKTFLLTNVSQLAGVSFLVRIISKRKQYYIIRPPVLSVAVPDPQLNRLTVYLVETASSLLSKHTYLECTFLIKSEKFLVTATF
jgi:hypothetical protein